MKNHSLQNSEVSSNPLLVGASRVRRKYLRAASEVNFPLHHHQNAVTTLKTPSKFHPYHVIIGLNLEYCSVSHKIEKDIAGILKNVIYSFVLRYHLEYDRCKCILEQKKRSGHNFSLYFQLYFSIIESILLWLR